MLESGGVVLTKGSGEDGIEEEEGMTEEGTYCNQIINSFDPVYSEKANLKKELEEEYAAQLEENAREMEEMRKTYEEKLAASR